MGNMWTALRDQLFPLYQTLDSGHKGDWLQVMRYE